MRGLSSSEREAAERASAEPMLDQLLGWATVNSGSRNLGGLERLAELLADAFAALPGVLRLEDPAPVEAGGATGRAAKIQHGRHRPLTVRPTPPVPPLLTGHMDTVVAVHHPLPEP